MGRPAKWNGSTIAIRVPVEHADRLLELARALDQLPTEPQPDPEFEQYASFVRNLKPTLLTVSNGPEDKVFHLEANPISFEEFKTVSAIEQKLEQRIQELGLNPLAVLAALAERIYEEKKA